MIAQFGANTFIKSSRLNELVDGINGLNSKSMTANEIIYVGTGQTYSTLSSALDYCVEKIPKKDYKIEIIVKSGFVVAEQLIYENVNFGHVILSSEDTEVNVNVSGFTVAKYGSLKPFFYLKNGVFPFINTRFKGNDAYETFKSIGFYGINSFLEFDSDSDNNKGSCGFAYGCVLEHSKAILALCNFKNIISGVTSKHSSLNLYGSNLSDCVLDSLILEHCIADISAINMNGLGAEHRGLSATNSVVHGNNIASNAKIGCLVGYGGTYTLQGINIKDNSIYGIMLVQGGTVNASGTTCTLSQTPNTITANGIIFK